MVLKELVLNSLERLDSFRVDGKILDDKLFNEVTLNNELFKETTLDDRLFGMVADREVKEWWVEGLCINMH